MNEEQEDFQLLAHIQGEEFHKDCLQSLAYFGFTIVEAPLYLSDVGIELDALTLNKNLVPMVWEFRGSWRGERPGLKRTDTVKKVVANAFLFKESFFEYDYPGIDTSKIVPLYVITNNIPDKGDSKKMLDVIVRKKMIEKIIEIHDEDTLRAIYEGE